MHAIFTNQIPDIMHFNDEIHKKQKFGVFNIFQSQGKRFFNSMINIFIFRCADPETWDFCHYFINQPTRNNSPNCPYNKK